MKIYFALTILCDNPTKKSLLSLTAVVEKLDPLNSERHRFRARKIQRFVSCKFSLEIEKKTRSFEKTFPIHVVCANHNEIYYRLLSFLFTHLSSCNDTQGPYLRPNMSECHSVRK